MSLERGRYNSTNLPQLADGWRLERLTPQSRLYGANGLRTGPDGRVYVAQVVGSQISAIDVNSGAIETISPMGSDIIGPDDLAFDPAGNLYVAEFTEGRVSRRAPNGETRVVFGEMAGANPITFHAGRLFAGELRQGGRILELDLNGGVRQVLLEDVPMVNGFEVGPDGLLYFPVMATNEIWRIGLGGGAPEVVARDLAVPNAVKFDAKGFIVSTQAASGQVLRINPRNGEREVLANVAAALDNLTFAGDRLFVSSISGRVYEVRGDGQVVPVVPHGLNFPLGLTTDHLGQLYVADGGFLYTLQPGQELSVAGHLFSPGTPGYVRGVAAVAPGEVIVTTGMGQVARWRFAALEHVVLADGFDRLYGVAIAPGGNIVFTEAGGGRVLSLGNGAVKTLASGLEEPMGVAIAPDGECFVSECAAGRVVRISNGRVDTVLDGLQQPQGVIVQAGTLYVLDAGAKQLIAYHLERDERNVIATGLPVGAPPGVTPKPLHGIPPYVGPMGPFADIAAGANGDLFISADAEGSVIALKRAIRPN